MNKLLLSLVTTVTILSGSNLYANCGGNTNAGAIAGGVIGGILGSQIGGGTGKEVATILGALGGAAIGSKQQQRQNNADCQVQTEPVTYYPQPAHFPPPPVHIAYPYPPPHHQPIYNNGSQSRILPAPGLYNNRFVCHKIEDSYWNGYQEVVTVRSQSECTDGIRTFDVDNAYVIYHMTCFAQNYSGQRSQMSGSPLDEARLEDLAVQKCESRFGRNACRSAGCTVRN